MVSNSESQAFSEPHRTTRIQVRLMSMCLKLLTLHQRASSDWSSPRIYQGFLVFASVKSVCAVNYSVNLHSYIPKGLFHCSSEPKGDQLPESPAALFFRTPSLPSPASIPAFFSPCPELLRQEYCFSRAGGAFLRCTGVERRLRTFKQGSCINNTI